MTRPQKVDKLRVVRLALGQHLSYAEIGRRLGCSREYARLVVAAFLANGGKKA